MKFKSLICAVSLLLMTSCATGRMLQTEEGRKFLIDSPEIKKVLRADTIFERNEKWCEVDLLLRFAVRMELTAQRAYIPVLSDEDACDE